MTIEAYGWNESLQHQADDLTLEDCIPARIINQDQSAYTCVSNNGIFRARLTGKLHSQMRGGDRPAVGDWVLIRPFVDQAEGMVHHLFERHSCFSRKSAGNVTREQIIAANIDVAFIVNGLDRDYNLRRMERYLTLVWDSGANPVLILNKADLCEDISTVLAEVDAIAFGIPVLLMSAESGDGLQQLDEHLQPGKTAVLIGSSGVGKSTIMNALIGSDIRDMGAVRTGDSRGRHTTTGRELFALPGGALIIDTPGMREIQLWADEDALNQTFEELDAFAANCRFRDCQHLNEPGCGVQEALESGELSQARFQSYLKQRKELRFLNRKKDTHARIEEHKRTKKLSKMIRDIGKRRK
ncbi:MAG: ribosome small subunit-dependent GTPase A [Calditrichia bacterium]